MTDELDPAAVAARLARLRAMTEVPFSERVARALRELRALCELADALHGKR